MSLLFVYVVFGLILQILIVHNIKMLFVCSSCCYTDIFLKPFIIVLIAVVTQVKRDTCRINQIRI